MKRCDGCTENKDESCFSWKNKAKGIKVGYCKTCKTKYNKSWYEKHKDAQKARVKARAKRLFDEAVAIINKFKDRPCTDCGHKFHPVAMDFDHVRGKKRKDISEMRGAYTIAAILAEINKCEVVCAVCHRLRTLCRPRRSTG